MDDQTPAETKKNQKSTAFLLIALFLLLAARLLPVFKAPLSTYGYDYGFYAYGIKHLIWPTLESFFPVIWGGHNNPLFYLSSILNIPGSIILNELYLMAAIFLGVALYLFFAKNNKRAGIFAVILLAASVIQSEAYTMFLWKNLVALPFLVLGFKFFAEKKYWPFTLCLLAVLLTHRTTAIVFLLTIILYFLFKQIRSKKILVLVLETAAIILLAAFFWGDLQSYFRALFFSAGSAVQEGVFLNDKNLISLLWLPALLALPGLKMHIKNKQHPLLAIFTFLTAIWVIFQFPFYRRMLIFLDIGLILYGAYFLANIRPGRYIFKLVPVLILLLVLAKGLNYTWQKQPLISQRDVKEIQAFDKEGFVLATSAEDGPWLLAWLEPARLAAPGMFEDDKSESQWQDFWKGQYAREFLFGYPRPLYLYQRSYKIPGPVNDCLKPLSKNFSEYTCE